MIEIGSALSTNSVRTPDFGGFDFFSSSSWYRHFGTPADQFAIDPRSADLLAAFPNEWGLFVNFAASTASGGNLQRELLFHLGRGHEFCLAG